MGDTPMPPATGCAYFDKLSTGFALPLREGRDEGGGETLLGARPFG